MNPDFFNKFSKEGIPFRGTGIKVGEHHELVWIPNPEWEKVKHLPDPFASLRHKGGNIKAGPAPKLKMRL